MSEPTRQFDNAYRSVALRLAEADKWLPLSDQPLKASILLLFANGDVSEGEYIGDHTWIQYRRSATRRDAINWRYLPKEKEPI